MGDGLLPDAGPRGDRLHPGVTGISKIVVSNPSASPTPPTGSRPVWPRLTRLLSGDVARQGYLAGIDQALISLTNFLASVLLARSVSPTQFGAYGVGFLLLHFVRSIQEGVVVQPMTSLSPSLRGDDRRRHLTGSALEQAALAVAGAAACALGGWVLIDSGNTVAGPTLFALWLPVLLAQPQEFIRRVFYTEEQVPLALLNTTIASVVRLATQTAILRAGSDSGTAGLIAIGVGGGAGLAVGLFHTRRVWIRTRFAVADVWRRNWAFGRWVLGGTITGWFVIEVYPILTAGLVSFAATGVYRALQNVVAPIHSLLRAMDTYFTPRLADRRRISGGPGVAGMVRRMYLVTAPVVVGVLLVAVYFAEPILRLLYGDTYSEYAAGMRWMALFYALWYSYWPIQSALKAIEVTRPIFIASLAATVMMFTVGVWAILNWGVYGTIAGQAFSALIVSVVLWSTWLRWRRREEVLGSTESSMAGGG